MPECAALYKFMYKNDSGIFLKRKKDKFESFMLLKAKENKDSQHAINKSRQNGNSSAFGSIPTDMSLRALFAKQSFKRLLRRYAPRSDTVTSKS